MNKEMLVRTTIFSGLLNEIKLKNVRGKAMRGGY